MAGHKQHDFHIVDPSPWPFLGAIGAFTMLAGAVLWMHGMTPYVCIAGFGLVIFTMFVWWSDVVKEAHSGDHTPVVQIGLRYGVILFIISEVMFFVAWFWNFFKHAIFPPNVNTVTGEVGLTGPHVADGPWPPMGIETVDPWHLPLLNTLILLTSGAACTWAHHAIMEGDRKGLVNGLIISILLGALFTAVQIYEYYEIVHLDWFQFAGNVYGGSFFMATGFHGAHVLIGTIFLFVCLIRALKGHFGPQQHVGFEAAAWYWHFVDVVWIFLFCFIYVWAA